LICTRVETTMSLNLGAATRNVKFAGLKPDMIRVAFSPSSKSDITINTGSDPLRLASQPALEANITPALLVTGTTRENPEIISKEGSSLLSVITCTLPKIDLNLNNLSVVYDIDSHINKVEQVKDKFSDAEEFIKSLNQLKETLVITTGDNYVGSADPQLREDLSKLYSKVAGGFVLPSKSELKNLKLISQRFDDAKDSYSKIKNGDITKLNAYLEANKLSKVEMRSFKDYVKSM